MTVKARFASVSHYRDDRTKDVQAHWLLVDSKGRVWERHSMDGHAGPWGLVELPQGNIKAVSKDRKAIK